VVWVFVSSSLSGFHHLWYSSDCRKLVDATSQNPLFLRDSYAGDSLRIFPIYYLSWQSFLLVNLISNEKFDLAGYLYLKHICITAWALIAPWAFLILAVEEQFYIFWPWLRCLHQKRS
jgi:hypothetical protein